MEIATGIPICTRPSFDLCRTRRCTDDFPNDLHTEPHKGYQRIFRVGGSGGGRKRVGRVKDENKETATEYAAEYSSIVSASDRSAVVL